MKTECREEKSFIDVIVVNQTLLTGLRLKASFERQASIFSTRDHLQLHSIENVRSFTIQQKNESCLSMKKFYLGYSKLIKNAYV